MTEHRGRALGILAEHRATGTRTMVPWPSIEPMTFGCRADAQLVMPLTRDLTWT